MFETQRLRARSWTLDDAEQAHVMYGDPEVVRHIGGDLRESVDATRELLALILERTPTLPAGMGSFPLALRETGEIVGAALIKPLPDDDGKRTEDIEIGWHLARCHWGNGYATEAGRALLEKGFIELDLPILHAVVEEPNAASHVVARRLGMNDEGMTDAYYGSVLRHYVLHRSDWQARSARETDL
ncbi:MAG: GNAT family N-acetyltransferase [bacterium]|nr:GNAT family N-acetyltransferase [bacterium]